LLVVLLRPAETVLVFQSLFIRESAGVMRGRDEDWLLDDYVGVRESGSVVAGEDWLRVDGSEAGVEPLEGLLVIGVSAGLLLALLHAEDGP
jgi:hypothetical protein